MSSSWLLIEIAYKIAHQNCQINFANCPGNRLKKRHLSLFTIPELHLHYHSPFKMLNKVCSEIPSSNRPNHTDTSQY